MYRSKGQITYVFRLSSVNDLKKAERRLLPKDYFYYYHFVGKYFPVGSISLLTSPFTKVINLFESHLLRMCLHFDFPIMTLLLSINTIKNAKIVFATTPKIGLGLALFKKVRIIKQPLIVNIVGLYDQLMSVNSPKLNTLVQKLYSEVDQFISGASSHEMKMLSQLLGIPYNKFQFIPHSGIDIKYFRPVRTAATNFILGVGIDPARDWLLYRKIAEKMPWEKFFWATDPRKISFTVPANVTIAWLSTASLKKHIQEAKLVLILGQPNHHFSGQASAMRAMSMAKTVVLTKTSGIEEFKLKHSQNCFMVNPNDLQSLELIIRKLSNNLQLRQKIGKAASRAVHKYYNYEKIGKRYVQLFKKFKH